MLGMSHITIKLKLVLYNTSAFCKQRNATIIRPLQTSTAVQHDSLFVHRDTPEDNPDIPFEFTPENKKVCTVIDLR